MNKTQKMQHQPKKMLVTGGAGFIGSNFIHYALRSDPDVNIINVDKLTYAASLNYLQNLEHHPRYHFIHADICDQERMQTILQEHDIDTIVHFAAESHVDRSIHSPKLFVMTNVLGTYALLEAARQTWLPNPTNKSYRFHHVSTDEVYGALTTDAAAFHEASPHQPRSPYSASKAGSDHMVNAYYHTYGLPMTISHCSNNYGPHQADEKFIPTIIHSCIKQNPIPIYGQGQQMRDWLFVNDHCRGIFAILQYGRNGETYDMGGNDEWRNIDLARYICESIDKLLPQSHAPKPSHTSLITFVDDRPGHDFRYAINTKKIKDELGWFAEENMQSGMQKTLQYYISIIYK